MIACNDWAKTTENVTVGAVAVVAFWLALRHGWRPWGGAK